MARIRPVHAYRAEEGKDVQVELEARIVEAITRIGPRNVSEISRLTKAPVETIRYKIKKQFKNLGLRIHAEADYRKMGLTLYWAKIRFVPQHLAHETQILNALNETAYLVYYGKVVPQGYYSALFAIPEGKENEYTRFLKFVQEMGVIQDFTLVESLQTKHHSMNPRYFNFRTGRWEIDWSEVALEEEKTTAEKEPHVEAAVDNLDLLLVKELQTDALQHVVAIARSLRIHPKTLEYHYRAHIEGQNLIPRYVVRWMNDLERPLSHSVIVTRLTLEGVGGGGLERMREITNKIPFLWSEDSLKDGTYVAWLMIPLEEATRTFEYIHASVPDLGPRLNVSFIKYLDSRLYTVPFHMFAKEWSFDTEEMKTSFKKAMSKFARK